MKKSLKNLENRRLLARGFLLGMTVFGLATGNELLRAEDHATASRAMRLWYDKPAEEGFQDALLLGNGRIGCMVLGGVERERIPFNENSLWTGDERTPGAYERFGELVIELEQGATKRGFSDYRRELSMDEARSRVTFKRDGVTHTRTVFVSQPEQVLVFHWKADRPGAISGTLRLNGAHGEKTQIQGRKLGFKGHLANGLQYEAGAEVTFKGGEIGVEAGSIRLRGCDELVVVVAALTNYVMDAARGFRGDTPSERVAEDLQFASELGFDLVLMRHLAHHQCFFRQVQLDLGRSRPEVLELPTDRRLAAYRQKPGSDPQLEALLFQYGRYLLLSSSHRTGLPEKYIPKKTFGWYPGAAQMPNLPTRPQGLWSDGSAASGEKGYGVDGPLQMGNWAAEPANVDKSQLPLLDLIRSQRVPWNQAAQAEPRFKRPSGQVRGWAVRTSIHPMGVMTGEWAPAANAWLCRHLWEHYAFIGTARGKQTYIERFAYPILKEVCQFWEDQLVTGSDGRWVVPGGTVGDQEMVWDLFNNYVEMASTSVIKLETAEVGYRQKIAALRDKLALPSLSHVRNERDLFGIYPGRRISLEKTPELATTAAAALVALEAQPGKDPFKSLPWRCALWARLGQARNAYQQFSAFINEHVRGNLAAGQNSLRLDGNLAMTGAVCEMLLQSQTGTLELLPALPAAWPEGSVKGLKAKGAFLVDIAWKAGKVTSFKVASDSAEKVRVKVNGEIQTITAEKGEALLEFQGW
ncbi:MAG: hypothetical protein RLZZ399_2632 [Verrucomicrobiota bacterium]|jgi:alpha-L-fucosidase 2